MKKLAFSIMFAVAVLVGFGWWIWSLGTLEPELKKDVILNVNQEPVEVKRSGASEWERLTGNSVLHGGDEVKTGAGGRASIRFYENSESRLNENSSLIIEEVRSEKASSSLVRLRLMSGRVWSRVLRLFDADSAFSIRTDSVVATVRGTTFDMELNASGTVLLVADSAISLASATSTLVPEGYMAVANNGTIFQSPINPEALVSPWYTNNLATDEQFQKNVQTKIIAQLKRRGLGGPESSLAGMVRLSELMHLGVAGEGAPDLYGRYLSRRLYDAVELIESGKSGLGMQAYMAVENDVKKLLKTPDGKKYLPAMRESMAQFGLLFTDIGPASPLYRFQQRLEDLNLLISGNDDAARLYARLLAIDSRLSVASKLITDSALEEAGFSLEGAKQGLQNIQSDLRQATGLDATKAEPLSAKLKSLEIREAAIRSRLQGALAIPPQTADEPAVATSTIDVITTSTQELPPVIQLVTSTLPVVPTSTPIIPVVTEAPWDKLTISLQPNPVYVGGMAQLRVTGSRNDGSTGDLTARSSFRLIGDVGTLNGPSFVAAKVGSATIEASYLDNGVIKTAIVGVQVNETVVLSSIEILTSSQTTLTSGQTASLSVKAIYSSGLAANVTSKTVWASSDPSIGTVTNGLFTAGTPGNVTVTGTYVENGVSKSNSLLFTITALQSVTGR